ncbi:MAG: hypothetical protein AB7T38_12180 [Nitrospirales bacterium]
MQFVKFGFVCMLLWVGLVELGWSATIVGGDVTAHWSGKGRMFEMENYRKFFHGEVNGVLEERAPLQESQGLFNRAQVRCQVSMNIEPQTKARDSFGTCTMTIPDTHEVVHSRWTCKSLAETCKGEFTWMWGTGRFTGISGTTLFQSRIEIGVTDSGAIHGEAIWPEFTYQLP